MASDLCVVVCQSLEKGTMERECKKPKWLCHVSSCQWSHGTSCRDRVTNISTPYPTAAIYTRRSAYIPNRHWLTWEADKCGNTQREYLWGSTAIRSSIDTAMQVKTCSSINKCLKAYSTASIEDIALFNAANSIDVKVLLKTSSSYCCGRKEMDSVFSAVVFEDFTTCHWAWPLQIDNLGLWG